MSSALDQRVALAKATLRQASSVIVAVSGGVDSAVLLALAVEAVGATRVLAVTGISLAVPDSDLEDARRVATTLGVRHEIVGTKEMDRPGYRANAGDRCYHCRLELFDLLEGIRFRDGFGAIAYGAIADDLSDDRPGMRAASERGILAPLIDAGMTKEDVRALAGRFHLEVHDKPASPCLASRIPVGAQVTPAKLGQIDRAEMALKALGFRQLRVRHHGEVARLELDPEGHRKLTDPSLKAEVVRVVKAAGFRHVALELEPFRSGRNTPVVAVPLYSITPTPDNGQ